MKTFYSIFLLLFIHIGLLEAQPFQYFPNVNPTSCQRTQDGGFMIAGDTLTPAGDRRAYLLKMDAFGQRQWQRNFGQPGLDVFTAGGQETAVGEYILPTTREVIGSPQMAGLYRFAASGKNKGGTIFGGSSILYEVTCGKETVPGKYFMGGTVTELSTGAIANHYVNFYTNTINNPPLEVMLPGFQETRAIVDGSNQNALALAYHQDSPGSNGYFSLASYGAFDSMYVNPVLISDPLIDRNAVQMIKLANAELIVIGDQQQSGSGQWEGFVMKLSPTGSLIWTKTYQAAMGNPTFLRDIKPLSNGDFILLGHETNTNGLYLCRINGIGDTIWTKSYHDILPSTQEIAVSVDSHVFGGYSIFAADTSNHGGLFLLTDSIGEAITSSIVGTVFDDQNLNCTNDVGESSIGNIKTIVNIIEQSTGDTIAYTTTDANGQYEAFLPFGTYLIDLQNVHPYLNLNCGIQGPAVLSQTMQTDTVDLPIEVLASCPLNYVDISPLFLRIGDTSQVAVQVCNLGTALSYPTEVTVVLDSFLTYISSNIPITNQIDDTLFFSVDTLAAGTCKQIQVLAWLDSSAFPGQTHCLEAYVTPDSLCVTPSWAGPDISVSGSCNGDSIHFDIMNQGAAMTTVQGYTIYIDDVIFQVGSFQLNQNDILPLTLATDSGATYRITAEQAPGYPSLLGDSVAIAFLEGCLPFADGSFNTGWITAYYNGNSSPFYSISCTQNVTSFDPNDKQAQPVGYGPKHFINAQTPLDYQIRFQNTGTDTAFRVVLLDTLSTFLNPGSIVMGAASHPYNWSLAEEGILRIVFPGIELPDSLTNEDGSQGFVRFRINQQPGNTPGTIIYNSADIYFDFNKPVKTNATFHEIGEDYIPTLTWLDPESIPSVSVTVYPNPFQATAFVKVEGNAFRSLEFRMTDLQGRVVYEKQVVSTNEFSVEPGVLVPGLYIYELSGNGKSIHSGKLMVQ